jgi:predicted RNA-binding protein YlxR (DUF448 family)
LRVARAKHVPLRRCVVCRRSRPQGELLRFYQEGETWRLDAARRAGGRGSWVCADQPTCWELKRLRRTFRAQADAVHALLVAYGERAQHTHESPDSPPDGGMNV